MFITFIIKDPRAKSPELTATW